MFIDLPYVIGAKHVIGTYKSFAKFFLDMGDLIIDSEVVAEDSK